MNDLKLSSKVILFSMVLFTISCQSNKQGKDSALLMAEEVAAQLDVITEALNSAKDYKTADEAGAIMDLAGTEIVKIYHLNQGLKTNQAKVELVSQIIKKSSVRLEEARIKAEERFKDDVPPKLKILTALNRFSENMKLANDPNYQGAQNQEEPKAEVDKPQLSEPKQD